MQLMKQDKMGREKRASKYSLYPRFPVGYLLHVYRTRVFSLSIEEALKDIKNKYNKEPLVAMSTCMERPHHSTPRGPLRLVI